MQLSACTENRGINDNSLTAKKSERNTFALPGCIWLVFFWSVNITKQLMGLGQVFLLM